jgi:hypothetical protein
MLSIYLWMPGINGVCFFVNTISLEKSDGSVFQTGCSDFLGQTGCSSLPNWSVQFWEIEHMFLFPLIVVTKLCHMHHMLYVHTHFCCTPRMHTYRGSSPNFS